MIDGKQILGNFINNICENTEIPEECLKTAIASLFYFVFDEKNIRKCISLIPIRQDLQIRKLDLIDPTLTFEIATKEYEIKFVAKIACDKKLDYPIYSVKMDDSEITEFKIASKFSCGQIQSSARDMEDYKIPFSLVFILIGLFVLNSAGTSFNRFLFLIAGILFFVLLVFVIFTLFDFQLSGFASTSVIGFLVGVSFFMQFIVKKVKQLFNGIITLLTVKIGYTYGAILFPNSSLHERVILIVTSRSVARLDNNCIFVFFDSYF